MGSLDQSMNGEPSLDSSVILNSKRRVDPLKCARGQISTTLIFFWRSALTRQLINDVTIGQWGHYRTISDSYPICLFYRKSRSLVEDGILPLCRSEMALYRPYGSTLKPIWAIETAEIYVKLANFRLFGSKSGTMKKRAVSLLTLTIWRNSISHVTGSYDIMVITWCSYVK